MQHNHIPTAAELTVGAALGCNTAWVSMSFKSLGLYAGLTASETVLDTVYLVSIISVALTLVVAGMFAQATERLISSAASHWALPVVIAASTIAMPACVLLPSGANIVGMVAVGAIAGVSSGLFLIRFGISFSLLSTGSCVIGAATSTILASFLFALFLMFDRLPACTFAASMPLFAGVLLFYGMHVLTDQGKAEPFEVAAEQARTLRTEDASAEHQPPAQGKRSGKCENTGACDERRLPLQAKRRSEKGANSQAAGAPAAACAPSRRSGNAAQGTSELRRNASQHDFPQSESALSGAALRRLTWQLAICSALIGFSNEAVRTLYVQMGIKDLGGTGYALVEGGGAFVATVVAVAVALLLANMKTQRMARNIYHFLILLLVVGVLLLLVPIAYGQGSAMVAHALNSASYACFGMFMWVILAGVCNRCPGQRVRTFAFVRAGWAVGPLLGMLAGRFVLHQMGISVESAMPIMGAGILAVLVASGFAFSETDLVHAMDLLPMRRKQPFREKCAKVAADYALSDREHEVMVLLAKGRNLPYIQDELLLSKSTVSTHRQHIYQKLGIHSQQELIDRVQATEV